MDTEDTFDRAYVEELRAEAAKYRTRAVAAEKKSEEFEAVLGDFNAGERSYLFGMLESLRTNPQEGAVKFRDMAKNILKDKFLEGIELPTPEPVQEQEQEPEEEPNTEEVDQVSLTQEELIKILDERDAAQAVKDQAAAAEAARNAEIEGVYDEIVRDTGFARGTEGFQLALARGAAMVAKDEVPNFKEIGPKISLLLGEAAPTEEAPAEGGDVTDAVENIVEGSGNEHAVTAGVQSVGGATETPKSVAEVAAERGVSPMEIARERMEARLS